MSIKAFKRLLRDLNMCAIRLPCPSPACSTHYVSCLSDASLAVCRFMVGSSDSDSDDDKRVVRSAKDRRFDELKGTCEEMRVSASLST